MSPDPSVHREIIEAIVQTGGSETPYRRAGRGHPTLLLCGRQWPDREAVFLRLASAGMVVEPLALPPLPEWPQWLRSVVDGLGLDRPDLAVSADVLEGARSFVREDPYRVGALVPVETIDP